MQVFDEGHIRNIVLVGGAKSGKTTLAETMMYEAKILSRRGTVEHRNTVSDFHPIEQERGISIYASALHTEWRNYKINMIDTPGQDDFIGEIVAPLRVADTCVLVINAQHGVEVGTELLWEQVDAYRKPVIIVINQLDHPKADFGHTQNSLHELLGKNAVLMQYPLQTGEAFHQVIDLLKMTLYKFPLDGGKPEKLPIPEFEMERAKELHQIMVEKAAENDEGLMEKYFEQGTLEEEDLRKGLHLGMLNHEVFPVFCLSALKNMGTGRLMGFIDLVAPAAHESLPEQTTDGKSITLKQDGPAVLFVYRTEYEPNLGKLTYFKVLSGQLKKGAQLKNDQTHTLEVMHQLFMMDGHQRTSVDELNAGDLGATLKLKNTNTSDTLHALEMDCTIRPIAFPGARMTVSIEAQNKRDDERLGEVLKKMHEQDPTVITEYNHELKQLLIHCQGELHLATIKWTLENVHGMEIIFGKPRIPYRETIQKPAQSTYRHKKQSGGAGQFAEVHMRIEPWYEGMAEPSGFSIREKHEHQLEWGGKMVFYNCIVGGAIDARFIPSVVKGVMHKMEHGPLTGSYVRDIRVVLYDGKMHPVDSNDISFQLAAQHAFQEAFIQAQPRLMEPVCKLEVLVPSDLMGDVITDLQARRGLIIGMNTIGRTTKIEARIPQDSLYKYTNQLRSLTQGRASFRSEFLEYAPVSSTLQEEIIKNLSAQLQDA